MDISSVPCVDMLEEENKNDLNFFLKYEALHSACNVPVVRKFFVLPL